MPTQQNTALPLGSPTSENAIVRPDAWCLIFCDNRGAWMKQLTSRSTESELDGRSSTIFSGLSGGRTARSEARILPARSTTRGRSGCDHRLRCFDLVELDLRSLLGGLWVELVSMDCRSTGESSLASNGGSFKSAYSVVSLPNVLEVTVREIADRPPIATDFRRCCVTDGAAEGWLSEDEVDPAVDGVEQFSSRLFTTYE